MKNQFRYTVTKSNGFVMTEIFPLSDIQSGRVATWYRANIIGCTATTVIQQSTGIEDKNGNLIFEGDRISWKFNGKEVIGTVEWDECNPCFVLNGDREHSWEYDFIMAGGCELEILKQEGS